jgi:ABC-2 type transport system permease protein
VTVLGRGVAHLTIFLPALALYFIVLPRLYGFSALGQAAQLFALASIFILATSFLGQAVGSWFKHPETPTLIFLGTSLPQLFLTGFSWPCEAITAPVVAAGYIFPSDLAIDGLVRINQLDASLQEVAHDWRGLWILAAIYFTLEAARIALRIEAQPQRVAVVIADCALGLPDRERSKRHKLGNKRGR